MPEPFALTCDSCGEPMLPNLSQADSDGCLWICINPDCPELCAGALEPGDLAEGGVSTSWGTGSDVEDKALAVRLVRLIVRPPDLPHGCISCVQGAAADRPRNASAGCHPMSRGIYQWSISRRRTMAQTAKLFMNGRSQAVRLPAEFRFSGCEVLIEWQGDAVILRPKPVGWDDFFAQPSGVPADFLADREDPAPEEREPS